MTATGITATARPTRRRVNVVLWVAQIALAAVFVFVSAPKLLGDPTAVATFHVIGFGQWFRYLTGACELAGAIGLLIPRLSGLAATALVGLMIGATLTNLFLVPGMQAAAAVTVLLGVVFAVIAWLRRDRTVALAATVRRIVRRTH
ncbi:MAG: DoxX family protein [Streptosporangiales bacterium]|nr:DoxX family protein [Streptosporangiales bacterium]MBO0890346.1 DoxX family protein [Acidothermales bacterium]